MQPYTFGKYKAVGVFQISSLYTILDLSLNSELVLGEGKKDAFPNQSVDGSR